MDTNETIRNGTLEDTIELGVASIETKGALGTGEGGGFGGPAVPGISEE